jgi:hypothetical protein
MLGNMRSFLGRFATRCLHGSKGCQRRGFGDTVPFEGNAGPRHHVNLTVPSFFNGGTRTGLNHSPCFRWAIIHRRTGTDVIRSPSVFGNILKHDDGSD